MGEALYSKDETQRYALTRYRTPDAIGTADVAVIGLNPSTATEEINDRTVARCVELAWRWDGGVYKSFVMLNLFPHRSTNPKKLYKFSKQELFDTPNCCVIEYILKHAKRVLCAWGNHGKRLHNAGAMLCWCIKSKGCDDKLYALKINKSGEPSHPLYIRKDTIPIPYRHPNPLSPKGTKCQCNCG